MIFNPLDDPVLHFCEEDGQKIEPNFYVPILPMALVNGSDGIGTGWSTGIPNYNPLDIIAYVRWKLGGSVASEQPSRLRPWYRGFTGEILVKNATTYLMRGTYDITGDDTMVITELPVKSWTQQYKQFLETLIVDQTIKDFKENHTDTSVHFTIQFTTAEILSRLRSKTGALEKKMKLESSLAISNMHMFNAQGCIQKYTSPEEVMEEFFPIRLEYYDRRKAMMLQKLRDERKMLENKTRFIEGVITGEIVIHNRRKSDLLSMLREHKFDCIVPSSSSRSHEEPQAFENENENNDPEDSSEILTRGYDYLLSMKLWSLTNERIEKLRTEFREKVVEHDTLDRTSIEELWTRDLTELLTELSHAEEGRLVDQAEALVAQSTSLRTKKAKTQKKKPVVKKKPAKAMVLNDSEDEEAFVLAEPPKAKTLKKKNKVTLIEKSKSVIPKQVAKQPKAAVVDLAEEEELSLSERMKLKRQKPKEKLKQTQAMMDEEEDISSLSQQLSRQMHVTPKKKTKQQPSVVSENEESEDDVFALKKNPKKRAKEQTPKKLQHNVLTAAKSPYRKSPKLKKIKSKSKASPMQQSSAAVVADVSPKGKAKAMMIPDRRPARAGRKQVVYDLQDSDEESQEEEEEESFFSEEDEESDFEDE